MNLAANCVNAITVNKSISRISACIARIFVEQDASACNASSFRPMPYTIAPDCAYKKAIDFPIPLVAPVTMESANQYSNRPIFATKKNAYVRFHMYIRILFYSNSKHISLNLSFIISNCSKQLF